MNRDGRVGWPADPVTALLAQRAACGPHSGAVTQNRLAVTNDEPSAQENLR